MPAISSAARRVAAALLGSTVLLCCAATIPAYAAPIDGTIKVTPPDATNDDTAQPDTRPIIDGCTFDVEFYNFDNFIAGIEVVTVRLFTQDQDGPSSGTAVGLPVVATLRQTAGSTFNGEQELSVDPAGLPRTAQGIPLRVEVDRLSGAEGKSQVFWLDCDVEPTTSPSVIPSAGVGPTLAATATAPATATATATPAETPSASPASPAPTPSPAATQTGSPSPHATPVKVNAGGESDGSGVIFLGIAGIGIAAGAGYGLIRGRKRG